MKTHLPPAVAVATFALAAAHPAEPALAPGLWETVNTPGVASLDGMELNDLPLFEIQTDEVCLTAADASDPATFLAGSTRPGCRIVKSRIEGARVDVKAVCPSEDGGADGSLTLAGELARESYRIEFQSVAFGDNGQMGFSGTLAARRIGDCEGA